MEQRIHGVKTDVYKQKMMTGWRGSWNCYINRRRHAYILTGCVILLYLFFTLLYIQNKHFIEIGKLPVMGDENIANNINHQNKTTPAIMQSTQGQVKDLPSITLILRATSNINLMRYMYCTLLRSVALYWSKYIGNVGIILDKESKSDHEWAENLSNHQKSMGINFQFYFEPLPNDSAILSKVHERAPGYNRQLYSSIIMDQFIETEVVAWIDTDGKFTVPVTPENIVNGNKLRVKGMNTFNYSWVQGWDANTKILIGKPMISDFMTYFPVYIWRNTITNCRNYILKYMKVDSIEVAFLKTDGVLFSPVNVIMTYAYYFESERYDWHIDIRGHDIDKYNKQHATPGFELTPVHFTPDLHVTLHEKYYKDISNIINKKAYCLASRNTSIKIEDNIKRMCKIFQKGIMWELFKFGNTVVQEHVTTWCKDDNELCLKLITDQYTRVKQLISQGEYDLNLNKVTAVENAAKDMRITCTSYF